MSCRCPHAYRENRQLEDSCNLQNNPVGLLIVEFIYDGRHHADVVTCDVNKLADVLVVHADFSGPFVSTVQCSLTPSLDPSSLI